jgi:CBS domain-containing protein
VSDIGLRNKLLVKDVMSSPVITIDEKDTANNAAELMDKNGVGCIIVASKEGNPLGIITERDLVRRVLTRNAKPDSFKAIEIMSSPLITVEPEEKISEAAKRMSRLNVRRLGVMYKGEIVGILSSKDVLSIMPELIEIIQEQALIEGENRAEESRDDVLPLTGYCDGCEGWSDSLKEINGNFLCEMCASEVEIE